MTPLETIACPFMPCRKLVTPLARQPRSDSGPGERVTVVPIHDVEGPGAWFGRCPGSHLKIPTSKVGQQVILAAMTQYTKRVYERVRDGHPYGSGKEPAGVIPIRPKFPIGRPATLPEETYFPGRPADAPQPGTGEEPAQRTPMDVGGAPLGKAAVMASRDELQQLIALTMGKVGEAQELCSRVTAEVERLEALAVRLGPLIEAANSLSMATVGTGEGRPEPAVKMAEQIAVAGQTVPDVNEAIMLVRARITALFEQLAGAHDGAEAYLALPK